MVVGFVYLRFQEGRCGAAQVQSELIDVFDAFDGVGGLQPEDVQDLEAPEGSPEWATRWVVMDRPNVEDQRVWSALLALGGADMPSTDRKYLYHEADFRNWLDELRDR